METKILSEKKRDFNQNLIEPPGSFEQLCDMISQLEKDTEIAECKRIETQAASLNYPDQVSDQSFAR